MDSNNINISLIVDFYVNICNEPDSSNKDKLVSTLKSVIQDYTNHKYDPFDQIIIHGDEYSIKVGSRYNNVGKRKIYIVN